ncbi:MAG: 4Fe-4S dicluster domain-containing protein [Planctomycetes bacterium]|nr:4Fe-4S dicluster domain-containing protein [Planctomycetota bacterium]
METHDDNLLLPFEDTTSSRRSFLRTVGFGIASAAMAGCSRGPVRYVVPSLAPSPEILPGRAYWIATTCGACSAGCGVLAKCRDGRPIKLEGNRAHPASLGGLCAVGQASVLSLYDSMRLDGARRGGASASFEDCDRELTRIFAELERSGGRVRLLTGSVHSPSTRAAIARFVARFADGRHVSYDPLPASATLTAYELLFGRRLLPSPQFERARTILAFDADFLGTWISPVEFGAAYTRGRELAPGAKFRHIQLESRLSLTGSRADERVLLAPWETAPALAGLCAELERLAGLPSRLAQLGATPRSERIAALAHEVWASRGASLVLCGIDELESQLLCAYANELLGNHGATLDLARPSQRRLGDERALGELAAELDAGSVDALVIAGVNPAYDLGGRLALARAKHVIVASEALDETAVAAGWVCPAPHALEAWDDGEPREGLFVLTQPTVPALRSTRSLRASLARWSGDARSDRDLVRAHWRSEIFPRSGESDFDLFFERALQAGFVELEPRARRSLAFRPDALAQLAPRAQSPAPGALALVLYAKVGLLDGRHAHNPWLQELSDPVTKIAWDNYACLAPTTAATLGIGEGDVVRVHTEQGAIELPAHLQSGQHEGVVAVALGYGRVGTGRFARVGPHWLDAQPTVASDGVVGVHAGPLVVWGSAGRSFAGAPARLDRLARNVSLACTQDYHSLELPAALASHGHEVRDAVRSTSHAEHAADPHAVARSKHPVADQDLWPDDHRGERRWGMTIDLARCTGCSACVIACQAENNVPVVGKDEVLRHREMSWIRIDRYYQGEGEELRTLHQPMLCQHCAHAPCESVCPVLATVHSAEGLNQQIYNRCVGTRYCSNTCPYKVRRFNWFDYPHEDALANQALNPDVTVRSRGVMEKCSFCVQRIQEAKARASVEGRALADGDVQLACQQSCPANAIVFGDLENPSSRVSASASDPRAYTLLEELNVQPSIRYLAHVHSGRSTKKESGHGG